MCVSSSGLDDLGWAHLEFSATHRVPETAGNAETILVVGKVMLEMVLLKLLVVRRKSEDVSEMSH